MKKVYLILAAAVGMTITSCTTNDYVGDVANTTEVNDGSIRFGSGFKAVTRADSYGKAAADLLGNEFIVTGVKGDGTGTGQTEVFKSYTVDWTQNTAGTTESNTADWEYVGKTNHHGLTGSQAIKYWDFSTTAYDFAAYSVGTATFAAEDGNAAPAGTVKASPINYATATTAAYTLKGAKDDLAKCYITDMKTVAKANYKNEVQLQFRALASKVRIALYETIPGYSVKDVYFYTNDETTIATGPSSNENATLYGTAAFYTSGTYTVNFPHIGSSYAAGGANATAYAPNAHPDYNKAHVSISGSATTTTTQEFDELNYTTDKTDHEPDGNYLKRASNNPSFAGTGTYYQTVLPNEENPVTLTLRVDYTLVSTDGSEEEITVHGATAYVPAAYTHWLPNYAYTYIFKISDNSNGWTSPNTSDPVGLYPITFDAVVLNNEETGHQTTITTVATPSISTYQKGHVYSASNEYVTGDIYAQVVGDGTLKTDLNSTDPFVKTYFYSLSAAKTEAEVMDALNIRTSGSATIVIGRNGLTLTPATIDKTITTIPGEDGNDINLESAGKAVKLSPDAAGTYAFVYQVSAGSPTEFNTLVELSTAPDDWNSSNNVYYTDFECTAKANVAFSTAVDLSAPAEEPADWNATNNVYYTNAACTTPANTAFVNGTYYKKQYYYKKYTNLNNTYAVKVIKVQ